MAAEPRSLKEIFLDALAIAPAERAAWLANECGPDAELRRHVELMLAAHDEPQSLIDRMVPAAAPHEGAIGALPLLNNPTETLEPEKAGIVIGPYKLLEVIGEGGMGTVWMADQIEPIQRRVAVKVIKEGMDSKQVLARFEAERQALALMEHPNIAKVLDAGRTPSGRPYFVMELVKGKPITDYCNEKRLGVRERLDLFGDVCRAVQHAHQKGIIHRDLKPSNVLVAPFDGKPVVKVIDFGVAKATGQRLTDKTLFTGFGALVGTPEYMSPEQAEVNNQDIDTRSDIYSLGVLLYELLTGSTPLTRKRIKEAALLEVLRVIREEEPPKPSTRLSSTDELRSIAAQRQTEPAKLTKLVRGELDWIVMMALEKNRNRRYDSANGLAEDIRRYLVDEPVLAGPPSAAYRLRKLVKRHRGSVLAASATLLTLLAGIAGTSWGLRDALSERDAADLARRDERQARDQAERLAEDEHAARKLIEAHRALERARDHFERQQPAPGLLWLARGLASVPEQDAELEHAFRMLLAGWNGEIHPRRQVDVLPEPEAGPQDLVGPQVLAFSPNQKVQVWAPERQGPERPVDLEFRDTISGARLGKLIGLPSWPERVVFSPDSKLLVLSWATFEDDEDRIWLRFWDVATRKPLAEARRHPWPIEIILFSADGKCIATVRALGETPPDHAIEQGVQLLEVPTGKPIGTPLPYSHVLALSPNGQLLMSLGRNPDAKTEEETWEIRLWDASTGKARKVQGRRGPNLGAAAFSPDGRYVALGGTVGQYSTILVWAATTGNELAMSDGHLEGEIVQLAISPDGKTVLAGTKTDFHILRFHKPKLGEEFTTRYMPLDEICLPITRLEPIPPAEPGERRLDAGEPRKDFEFSPDGAAVLLLTKRGYRLFDTSTGEPIGEPLALPTGIASPTNEDPFRGPNLNDNWFRGGLGYGADFAADGKSLLLRTGGHLYRFGLSLPQRGRRIGQSSNPTDFLPLGGSIFYNSLPDQRFVDRLKFYDKSKKESRSLSHGDGKPITGPVCSPDGRTLMTFGELVRLWDAATYKPIGGPIAVKTVRLEHYYEQPPFAFSADGKILLLGDGTAGRLYDTATATALGRPLEHQKRIRAVAFSPNGKRIVTGGDDMIAQLWDVETCRRIGEPMIHDGEVRWSAYSPDGSKILTQSFDPSKMTGRGWFWDAATGRPLGKSGPLLEGSGNATRLFSRDRQFFVAGDGWDKPRKAAGFGDGVPRNDVPFLQGKLRLWDAGSGKPRGPYLENVTDFSPDASAFVSGGLGVQIWNTHTGLRVGRPLWQVKASRMPQQYVFGIGRPWCPISASFAPDGANLLASASDGWDSEMRLIEVPQPLQGTPERLRVWLEVITGAELDPGGEVVALDAKTWRERAQRLEELGGPPVPR
jgi:serine/threonine protein kinase/WD40 repeat protein